MKTFIVLLFCVFVAGAQERFLPMHGWSTKELLKSQTANVVLELYSRYEKECQEKTKVTWDTLVLKYDTRIEYGTFYGKRQPHYHVFPRGTLVVYPKRWEVIKQASIPTLEGFIAWLRKQDVRDRRP
jgi:hypothetical protein